MSSRKLCRPNILIVGLVLLRSVDPLYFSLSVLMTILFFFSYVYSTFIWTIYCFWFLARWQSDALGTVYNPWSLIRFILFFSKYIWNCTFQQRTFCEKEILGKCVLSWVIYGAKQRKTVNPCFDIELMKLRACMIILFRSQSMTTPTTHVGFRSLILEQNGVILPGGKHLQVLHQSPTHPQGLHLSDSWCGLDAPTSGGRLPFCSFL